MKSRQLLWIVLCCLGTEFLVSIRPAGAAVAIYTDRDAWEAAVAGVVTEDFESETRGNYLTPFTTAEGTTITSLVSNPASIFVRGPGIVKGSVELLLRDHNQGVRFNLTSSSNAFAFDYDTDIESWTLEAGGTLTTLPGQTDGFIGYISDSGPLSSFVLQGPVIQEGIAIDDLSQGACDACQDQILASISSLRAAQAASQASLERKIADVQAEVSRLQATLADIKMEIKAVALELACTQPKSEQVVCPFNVEITERGGDRDAGDHTTLCQGDNQHLIIESEDVRDGLRRVEWIASFNVGSPDSICSKTLEVEGNLGLRSEDVELTVYNWETGSWDSVGKPNFGKAPDDKFSSFSLAGYVSSGGEVRIRLYLARKAQKKAKFHMATDTLRLRLKRP